MTSTPTTPLLAGDDLLIDPAAARLPARPAVFPESKTFSVASLVLGLCSLAFGYVFVVPIVGLVLGILALNREPSNRAMSIWGIVLSGTTLLGGLLAVLFGISLLIPAGIASAIAG